VFSRRSEEVGDRHAQRVREAPDVVQRRVALAAEGAADGRAVQPGALAQTLLRQAAPLAELGDPVAKGPAEPTPHAADYSV
jgi:hypothetical protein